MKKLYTIIAIFLCLMGRQTISQPTDTNWTIPEHSKAFLAGELSATSSRLGVFVVPKDGTIPCLVTTFERPATREVTDVYAFIGDVVSQSRQQGINLTDACFSAAGFPHERTLMSTHTKVKIKADDIAEAFHFNRVEVLNDFQLAAYAIDTLAKEEVLTRFEGEKQEHAPRIIVGASTGLGFCIMAWDTATQAYKTVGPAWGGGLEFSAETVEELELNQHILNAMNAAGLQKAATRWGGMLSSCHPSAGLRQIYQFYKNKAAQTAAVNPAEVPPTREFIVENRNEDPVCKQAVEKYMELYARCVRNLASVTLPFGGIYIAGEFAALYPELFTFEGFVKKAFFNLDNLAQMNGLERFPVHIITRSDLTLLGAAQFLALTS